MELQIKDVCKTYGSQKVLDHFSLTVPKGKTVCLFGPSGCGKTTLLQCIASLEKLDSGTIAGMDRKKISYMFQEDRLLPWISAAENISVVWEHPHREDAIEWLRLVELEDAAEKRPAELSGGMRQRVALARALAYDGDPFLLDEPFRALDQGTRRQMMDLLCAHTKGKTKILVTHDLGEARLMADCIAFLEGPPLKIVRIERIHA
ncbi:ATP-binding cassette domain-containing protein [Clostridium sp. D33t1_170424_F3]|uniref:ABC transporter ATP-binding protein n=1 Tax=Clostridium sp. D33t1_170424_F3 TaxID=2787099 RepID=UPI0018AA7481|nr:ATP-binding cassette domain-containing protein [Clostridium sp. D33t1_170424_F3]